MMLPQLSWEFGTNIQPQRHERTLGGVEIYRLTTHPVSRMTSTSRLLVKPALNSGVQPTAVPASTPGDCNVTVDITYSPLQRQLLYSDTEFGLGGYRESSKLAVRAPT